MALGNYNNNGEQQMFRPTVYGYSLYSNKSEIEKSRIAFSMWQKTIKISIEKCLKEGGDGQMSQYDTKNPSVIYLTASKAFMLAEILAKYVKEPEKYSGYGVSSAKAFISITNVDGEHVLQIDSISTDEVREGDKYVINTNHPVISGWRSGNKVYDNDLMANLDFIQIIGQLRDYGKAMNNAIAFSVVDNGAWNTDWYRTALKKIASASNVELSTKKSYNNNGGNNKSSFSGSESTPVGGELDDFM